MKYFPELGGIVWVNSSAKSLHLFNTTTNQWSTLAINLTIGDYDTVIEHSPVHHVILFGGGKQGVGNQF